MHTARTEDGLRILVPTTRRERMRGLRGYEPVAMLFERARSVHTFGMRQAIVVAFLDRHHRVIYAITVGPRRIVWSPRARHVLEAPAGTRLRRGDRIVVRREDPQRRRARAAGELRPGGRGAAPSR